MYKNTASIELPRCLLSERSLQWIPKATISPHYQAVNVNFNSTLLLGQTKWTRSWEGSRRVCFGIFNCIKRSFYLHVLFDVLYCSN